LGKNKPIHAALGSVGFGVVAAILPLLVLRVEALGQTRLMQYLAVPFGVNRIVFACDRDLRRF
jgi:hypothetical protein